MYRAKQSLAIECHTIQYLNLRLHDTQRFLMHNTLSKIYLIKITNY